MKQKKESSEFSFTLRVPVRRKLDPELERSQRPRWTPPPDLRPAITRAASLTADQAAALLAGLTNAELPDHNRTTLLIYYAKKGVIDQATAIKVRRDLLLWLVNTFPQDPILTSSYALVNPSGEPLADNPGASTLKQAWLEAVAQYPKDISVAAGAANFLRTVDPSAALRIVSEKVGWDIQINALADLYANAGLGVNAISPDKGVPLSTSSPTLTDRGIAASFRAALLASNDLKLVLSAVDTTSSIARALKANHALPAGYDEYCQALMQHTRQLYPETTLDCRPSATQPAIPYTRRIAPSVAKVNQLKTIPPKFPLEVKKHPPTASIRLRTFIDTKGRVNHVELISGPLSLYEATHYAVLQWEYQPPLFNGQPANVSTEVDVNFRSK